MALSGARAALREALADLSDEEFRRKLAHDAWSIVETLEHVARSERHLVRQLRAGLAGQSPPVSFLHDADPLAGLPPGSDLSPPAVVHDLAGARYETTALLDGLEDEALGRALPLATGGNLTVGELLALIAHHDAAHLRQIEAQKRVLRRG